MLRRLVILFVALSSAVTAGAVVATVANDLDVACQDGHTWEDQSVVLNATCEEEGVLLQVCSACGEEQEVAIKALGHELAVVSGSKVDPTCEENGIDATMACTHKGCDYEVVGDVIPAIGHEYGAIISVGDGTHKKVCANDATHEIITACSGGVATCTQKAICEVCGEEYGALANHVYDKEVVDAKYLKYAANCQDSAVYYKSCDCGHFDEDESETFSYGSTAGHSYDREVAEAGFLASEATCEDAATYYLSCVCGEHGTETFTYGEALGHDWDDGVVTTDPTCDTVGEKTYTCSNDANHTKTEEVDALGHAWDNGVVTTDPTCEGAGEKTYTCGNDANHTKTEEVDALGHDWDDGVVTTDPTCEGAGEKTYTCGNDANHTKTEEVAALGHVGSTDVANKCANCGEEITVDQISAMTKTLTEGKSLTGKFQLSGTIVSINGKNVVINVIGASEKFEITCYSTVGDAVANLSVGDVITVTGTIKNYYNTIEFDKPTLESAYHTINIEATENGTVTADIEGLIVTGTSATITVAPATGYELDNFYVNGAIVEIENNIYTFVVEKSVTISASFKVIGSQGEVVPETLILKHNSATTVNMAGDVNEANTFFGLDAEKWSIIETKNKASQHVGLNKDGDFRLYWNAEGGNTLEISSPVYLIKTISITFTGSGYSKVSVTVNGELVSGNNGEYEINASKFVLGNANTSNAQVRISKIEIKYVEATNEPACEHEYDAVVTEPDCENGGYTTYTCSKCGDSYIGNEVDALGHDYDAVVTEPDCENGGYTTYTCGNCGDTYVGNEVDALGHDYDAVVTEPDCENGGYTTYTCGNCGDTYVGNEVDALGHDYDAVVTEPDCENGGYTTYTCGNCGDTYVGNEVDALGHDYEAIVLENDSNKVSDATCEVYAIYYKVCACGEVSTETFEDVNGGYAPCVDSEDDNACDNCGSVMCNHVFDGPWTSYDEEKHSRICQNDGCDKVEEATHTFASEYAVIEGELKLVSTCECEYSYATDVNTEVAVPVASGKDLATVLSAGYDVVLSDDVIIEGGAIELTEGEMELDLAGHTIQATGEKGPYYEGKMVCEVFYLYGDVVLTIKGEGTLTTDYECDPDDYVGVISACDGAVVNIESGNYITNGDTAIYATRGGIVNIKAGYFNATEQYEGKYYTLDINEIEEEKGIINVYGGKFVNFDPANHTNDGASYTNKVALGYHSVLVVEDGVNVYVVSAHNYGELVEEVGATCEEDGMKSHYYCVDCGTYFDAEKNATTESALVLGATGHDYDEEVTAPTCENDGYTTYTCACGDSYTDDVVPATGHDYDEEVTAPTCENDGYTTYTCACGDSYTDNTVSALGHNYGELVEEVSATCTTAGKKAHYYCEVCETYFDANKNATTESALAIAPSHNYVNGECTVCHAIKQENSLTFKHNKTTTSNMAGGVNEANDCFSLNESEWSVIANAGSSNNQVGLNSAGDFRLYGHANGGNTLTISSTKYTIKTIKITFTGDSYSNVKVLVGGNVVTATNGVYAINANSFVLGNANANTTQVRIKNVVITYGIECVHTNKTATHKDATCTAEGYTQYTCSSCNHSWKVDVVPATGHDEEMAHTEAKEATCVAEGNLEYYYCSKCECYFADEEGATKIDNVVIAIDAENHANLVVVPGTPATCQASGLTDGEECTACGETTKEQITINPVACEDGDNNDGVCDSCGNDLCAHENTEEREEVSATCVDTGLTAGVYCNDCEKYLEGGETISATGAHNYNDLVETNATTHTYKCETCEDRQSSNHEYEVVSGTYTDDTHTIKCDCGHETTADHDFTNGDCACGKEGAPVLVEKTYSYTFTSKQYTANGAKSLGGVNWTLAGNGNYWGYDGSKGQQLGSASAPYKSATLTSTSFSNVKKIVVNASTASSATATLVVKVNGVQVGSQKLTATATEYTFDGGSNTGAIELSYTQTTSKALYIKSISVTYAE